MSSCSERNVNISTYVVYRSKIFLLMISGITHTPFLKQMYIESKHMHFLCIFCLSYTANQYKTEKVYERNETFCHGLTAASQKSLLKSGFFLHYPFVYTKNKNFRIALLLNSMIRGRRFDAQQIFPRYLISFLKILPALV